ncbi:nucleoid-associated protein, YbaB/EbfC family [candidate division WOR-1 bacterium RIFCSPLOWO2_02_FULL_46_20]|uniref:Nucleoid-associated protein A3H38_00595 n=2 Tax=Saganbacteria TaxID=1703751 RepID=A0A1F4RF64_UNCSA|nr:MAG: nucleoid-associated protein, YbaB/EbfC family [candidate division WOR-1 bacterium RIFCSPHIGHO2_02_FULL_45_12]OGC06788.1 MAG: nucleoid-associated protein, YbaB/EbfC family [candidate division WOR-1 bacterium RIFCSPLOWO2_02_FULL_46_20]OGC07896.1 MAG: nucleoid-associated protein, YbaB/EbfC family [candidate division WOR-1 bacterium RIFCSPLOWO2_12_FULL_45_9]
MIFGNMGDMMKMAKEMQGQLKRVKDELSRDIFEGTSGEVVVTVSGDMEVKDVKIAPNANPGKLEKDVKEAVSRALKQAKDGAAQKMKGITGGMNLPGMF